MFDDFRLLYASNDKGTDLILDEDRDNLDYLKDCSSNTYKNTVLHLNKTFTKDKWNSFVLPVSLKRDQFRQAFGANARLAKLDNLTSSEIQFKTVDIDATATDVVLDAYTPYIIFPTKIHTDGTKVSPAYKATLSTTDGESKTQEVVIKANHYDIPNVTFETTSANKNDLSQMDTRTWVSNVTTKVENSNGTMKAYGTFARTFGQKATQNVTDEKAADIKPQLWVMATDTNELLQSSWVVNEDERREGDYGEIIDDKGEGNYGKDEYDPWNSSNW